MARARLEIRLGQSHQLERLSSLECKSGIQEWPSWLLMSRKTGGPTKGSRAQRHSGGENKGNGPQLLFWRRSLGHWVPEACGTTGLTTAFLDAKGFLPNLGSGGHTTIPSLEAAK